MDFNNMKKDKDFQKWCFDTDLVGNKNWFNLENGSGDEVYIAYEAWVAGQQSKQEEVNKLQEDIDELTKQNQKLHTRVANLEMQIRDAIEVFDNLHSESLKDDVRDIIKPFISGDLHE